MKSRKLISFLGAAAMAGSAFSGLTLTASAAEPVWSFDGSDVSAFVSGEGASGIEQLTDEMGQFVRLYARGSSNYQTSIVLPSEAQLEDGYVIEYDVKMNQANGMGRYGRYNQVAFGSASATKDTRDYGPYAQLVLDSGVEGGNTASETGSGYTSGVASSVSMRFGLPGAIINDDATETLALDNTCVAGITSNKWVRVQAVVSGDTTTVTVIDAEGNTLVNAQEYNNTADKLETIYVVTGRGDGTDGPGEVCLDNIRIYSGAADTLTTEGLRGENTGGIIYETVPVPEAPEGLNIVSSENFDSVTPGRVALMGPDGETDREENYTPARFWCEVNGDATGENNWTVVANSATDPELGANNYIAANNGMRSSGARGPKFQFNYGEIAERETVVAQFATRLHASTDQPAELIFLGDLVSSTTKQNMAAPLAMITTDAEAKSEVYDVDNALVKGGANVVEVPDNTWITVKIEAYRSEGKTATAKISVDVDGETTYIFGDAENYANLQNSNRSGINTLPYISFRSGNSEDYYGGANASNTSNDIDNISIYSSNATATEPTPAPVVTMTVNEAEGTVSLTSDVDTTVTLAQASYVTDGTLAGIKTAEVALAANTASVVASTGENAQLNAFTIGDKLMVLDSLDTMRPLSVAYTVTTGADQVTPAPVPTEEATEAPSEEVTDAPTEEATEAPSEEVTDAPTEEATEAPSEEVTEDPSEGTVYVDEDFESYTAGTLEALDGATGIASIPGFSGKTSAVLVGAEGQGNVLWLRGGGSWTPETAITESVKMDFDIHYGYYEGSGKTGTWDIKNSNGDVIASVMYDATACAITAVTIGDQTMDLTGVISVQDGNDFDAQNSKAHTSVVVDTTNKAVKITLTKGDQSSVFTGSLGDMVADFASWNFTNYVNFDTRCSTVDNFVVASTTETVEVAE